MELFRGHPGRPDVVDDFAGPASRSADVNVSFGDVRCVGGKGESCLLC